MVYYGIASFQITHWRTLRNLQIKEYTSFSCYRTARIGRWRALPKHLKICHIYIYIASIRIYRNNRKDSTNKRRSCSRQHEEGDEIRFGSFYRESFVCLTWIYRWNQWRIFVYKYKLSLVLLYWNDMLMNKLKTKSNGVLNRMVSKTESNRRIHNFFGRNVSAKATQMASNVEFVGKKTWQQWGHLRTKIVIVDSKNICQISSFLCSIVSLF